MEIPTKHPESYGTDPNVAMLRVEVCPGHTLQFPYQYLAYTEHEIRAAVESLVLVFATHEIRLEGVRLARIESQIQKQLVAWLMVFPEKYRSLLKDDQPYIQRIEVKARENDQPE